LTLWSWHRRHFAPALVAAVLTPLASPVAGVCLVIAAAAVAAECWKGRRSVRRAVAIAGASAVPLGLTSVLFGSPGWFPFRGGHLVISIMVLAGAALTVRVRVVRIGACLAIAVSLALYVLPNPLGGNFIRLAQIVAVPLAVAAIRLGTPSRGRIWKAPSMSSPPLVSLERPSGNRCQRRLGPRRVGAR
jgi:hypothetical protein